MQGMGSKSDEKREHSCYQVNSGYHHGGCMDQGTDRSRAFHCVGQPDMEGEHGTFSGTSHEHQSQSPRQYHAGFHQLFLTRRKGEGLHVVSVNQNTDEEAQVGKTSHDKGFFAGCNGLRLGIIETDEQVRGNTYQLPEYVHLEDIGSHYQSEHGEGEK